MEINKVLQKFWQLPPVVLVVYLLVPIHLYLLVQEIADFGIGVSTIFEARVWLGFYFTLLCIGALTSIRWFYYAYIFSAIYCMVCVFWVPKNVYETVYRTWFPLIQIFAAVYVIDLQRVIFKAHRDKFSK